MKTTQPPLEGAIKTLKQIVQLKKDYEEFEEIAEKIGREEFMRIRKEKGITTHHGQPSGLEAIYIENGKIDIGLDTSCCGGYDSDYVSFTLEEFYEKYKAVINSQPVQAKGEV